MCFQVPGYVTLLLEFFTTFRALENFLQELMSPRVYPEIVSGTEFFIAKLTLEWLLLRVFTPDVIRETGFICEASVTNRTYMFPLSIVDLSKMNVNVAALRKRFLADRT